MPLSFPGNPGYPPGRADGNRTGQHMTTTALVLTRYDRLGASSRLRTMQYLPALAAAGIAAEVRPFFDDAYVEALNAGQGPGRAVPGYYLRRWRDLRAARGDLLWLEKEAFPWLPSWFERIALPRHLPLICDYDDAVFHRYDLHRSAVVRAMLGRKIDRLMRRAALVTAGNAYLAGRARAAGAARVEIVPTVVDAAAYDTAPLPPGDGRPRIGWIGSPGTWETYMQPLLPMLQDMAREHGALIRAVGTGPGPETEQLERLPWAEETESRLIQSMDIGIMPLDDSPWARGKCGYKLIQYMACGLPVIASPVGVNREIVEDGVTGFLVTTDAEWRAALARLLADAGLRRRMGAEGRRRMEERYSLQVWGPRVAQMLRQVAGP